MNRVFCPECQAAGDKSTVHPGSASTTCMFSGSGHYDEGGKWVDPPKLNTRTTSFSCSNGHKWLTKEKVL